MRTKIVSGVDSQAAIVGKTLRGVVENALVKRDELRYHVARDVWTLTKRFGSRSITNVELRELPAIQNAVIEGYIDDPNRSVLAAICRALPASTFFEIGTNRGRTAWTIARNNPDCHVYTLDLPSKQSVSDVTFALNESDRDFFVEPWDRGEAYRGTDEEARITTLEGDSATFDFSPYARQVDVVFVDGAHSSAYVMSDTENALGMLAPGGIIAWDDYPAIPGVYRYLNEVAPRLNSRLYHIYGTRLVIYSGGDVVQPVKADNRARRYVA